MELLAALGQYLLAAFVLPGLCYLLVFAMLYSEVLDKIRAKLPAETGKESSQGFLIGVLAVGGGLLLSSVTFAIELFFRGRPWFDHHFPDIDFVTLALSEKGMLSAGAAIMHFNIGVGIFIILLAYPIYALCRKPDPAPESKCVMCRPGPWFAAALLVLTLANLKASSAMFHRTGDILLEAKKLELQKREAATHANSGSSGQRP